MPLHNSAPAAISMAPLCPIPWIKNRKGEWSGTEQEACGENICIAVTLYVLYTHLYL